MAEQRVVRRDDTVLEIMVPEEEGVAIDIVPPGRCCVCVKPLMSAPKGTLCPAVTGGSAVRTSPGGEGGAVPTEDEGLEMAEEAPRFCHRSSRLPRRNLGPRKSAIRPYCVSNSLPYVPRRVNSGRRP